MARGEQQTRYQRTPQYEPEPRDNPVWVVFCVAILLAVVWFGAGAPKLWP
jgi:hypothetical protein